MYWKKCTKITRLLENRLTVFGLENKLTVFGLTYTVCFYLSHTDDVVRLIGGKNIMRNYDNNNIFIS